MGLFAITSEAIKGLLSTRWGEQIGDANKLAQILVEKGILQPDEINGLSVDSGVQPPVTELANRLASTVPISQPGTLELRAPVNVNSPAIRVFVRQGQDAIEIVRTANPVNSDGSEPLTADATNGGPNAGSLQGDLNATAQYVGGGGGGNSSVSIGLGGVSGGSAVSGFNGTVTIVTSVSVSIADPTVTINSCDDVSIEFDDPVVTPTTTTLTFVNGVLTGVA